MKIGKIVLIILGILISIIAIAILGLTIFYFASLTEHKVTTGLEGQTFIVDKSFYIVSLDGSELSANEASNYTIIPSNEYETFKDDKIIPINEGTKIKLIGATYHNYFEGENNIINVEIDGMNRKIFLYYNPSCAQYESFKNSTVAGYEEMRNRCIFQNGTLKEIK